MQVKKDCIRDEIIESARCEFLKKGYTKASLRTIAEKKNLTKGAIYSYFKTKDMLFCEITTPAINLIINELKVNSNNSCLVYKGMDEIKYIDIISRFRRFAYVVINNIDIFRLLLFCSAGSSLEDCREKIIKIYADNFYSWFSYFKVNTETDTKFVFSEMFVHSLASTFVSFIEEIIIHEPHRDEVEKYVEQMAIFVNSGVKSLLQYQVNKLV